MRSEPLKPALHQFARVGGLALQYRSGVRRVSRNFASFTDLRASLELFLRAKHALLDGEIICWMKNRSRLDR